MLVVKARFDGKVFVPSQQVSLPKDKEVTLRIEDGEAAPSVVQATAPWRPLEVRIDPALGRAIAEDSQFNLEES
jgi:hypothetical protein